MVRWAYLKRGDAVGTSIRRGSAYDVVLNTTLDVLSAIACGSWNFQGQNHILLYLKISSIVCMHEWNYKENVM